MSTSNEKLKALEVVDYCERNFGRLRRNSMPFRLVEAGVDLGQASSTPISFEHISEPAVPCGGDITLGPLNHARNSRACFFISMNWPESSWVAMMTCIPNWHPLLPCPPERSCMPAVCAQQPPYGLLLS